MPPRITAINLKIFLKKKTENTEKTYKKTPNEIPEEENTTKKEQFQLDGKVHIRPLSSSYFQSLTGLKQCFFEYRLDNNTNTKIYQIQVSIVWEEGLNLGLRFYKSLPDENKTSSLAATGNACDVNTAILPQVTITKCKMRGVRDEEACKKAVEIDWRPAPFRN
jgi:hypothetical protein